MSSENSPKPTPTTPTTTPKPTTPAPAPPQLRMSIWSVTADLMPAYLILFDILAIIGVGYVAWYHTRELTTDSIHATIWGIITGVVTVGVASAIISILILETGKYAMIVGTYFERKFKHRRETELAAARAEASAEGRAEGRAEGVEEGMERGRAAERKRNAAEFNTLIDEWEKRRDEATEKGEPFDEPIPRMKE